MARENKNPYIKRRLFLIVLLLIIGAIVILPRKYGNLFPDPAKNDYQAEVNRIIPPDFTLISSQFDSGGIDVGQVLTDDYTTYLSYDQAISLMESNTGKLGYKTPYYAQCFGGIEYSSDRGRLVICETNIQNGVTTFEISLTNFSKVPPKITPSFQCAGDCKNQ